MGRRGFFKKPRIQQVKRAARDNWLNRNQPQKPRCGNHIFADRLISAFPGKRKI